MNAEEIYRNRINRAIDFINGNLHRKITIDEISNAACFSTYHFHRIFKAFLGESIYAYVNRLRVEKAAADLLSRKITITEAAFLAGFGDSATFARAFKKRFGVSASSWRDLKKSKIHQAPADFKHYADTEVKICNGIVRPELSLKRIAEERMVYVRYVGAFSGNYKVFRRLHRQLLEELQRQSILWKRERGYFVIYHDSSGITAPEQQRLSYGVISDSEPEADGGLGVISIQENNYLAAEFSLGNSDYGQAWTVFYRDIIPAYGMEPVNGFCYENYSDDCYDQSTNKTRVTFAVPVRKISI